MIPPRVAAAFLILLTLSSLDGAPNVFTAPPVSSGTNALCRGAVVPNGDETTFWFEWGVGTNFNERTEPAVCGAAESLRFVSATITNLNPEAVYHCRLVASNAGGFTTGPERRWTLGKWLWFLGDDGYKEVSPPVAATNIIAVAIGDHHTIGLRADRKVFGWGRNFNGETSVPTNLNDVIEITSGTWHSLALKADGTVVGWGQTVVPSNLNNVVAISAGSFHSAALQSNGTVVLWGNVHVVPVTFSNAVALASGYAHTIILRTDGTVATWVGAPAPSGLSNVVAIGAGLYHNLALKADGSLVAWGNNSAGEGAVPAGVSNVAVIAAGGNVNMFVEKSGHVRAWGSGFPSLASPWPGLEGVAVITAGLTHHAAIARDAPVLTFYPTAIGSNTATFHGAITPLVGLTSCYFYYARNPDFDSPALTTAEVTIGGTGQQLISASVANLIPNELYYVMAFARHRVNGFYRFTRGPVRTFVSSPGLIMSGRALPSDGFRVSFKGALEYNYTVWSCTNLNAPILWENLGSPTQAAPGLFQYSDHTRSNFTERFYRVTRQ